MGISGGVNANPATAGFDEMLQAACCVALVRTSPVVQRKMMALY